MRDRGVPGLWPRLHPMKPPATTWHTDGVSDANKYRDLPRVDELVAETSGRLPAPLLVELVRSALDDARAEIGRGGEPDVRASVERQISRYERLAGIRVVNATGVLLHTNLGRARWSRPAVEAAMQAASDATNLELDVESGDRTRRGRYVIELLRVLTGADDALVVNNNASAVVLALAATSAGRAVPVARGELIEIGGSYRLPEVMKASGCTLVEVGTTNRTRIGDFETAVQVHRTGSLLKIHPSNYRVEGFTEQTGVSEMADLAKRVGVPLIYDIGSGLLDSQTPWLEGGPPSWLKDEPAARQALIEGADVVTFSGDKLLGGPQAGVIVGKAEQLETLRAHPLARALRVDGVTLAALAVTLDAYANRTVGDLPFWSQAAIPPDELAARSERLAGRIGAKTAPGNSAVGGGSVPGLTIPTHLVVVAGRDDLYDCLLAAETPVLARRDSGDLVVDLRTVDSADDELVAETLARCL